MDIILQLLFRKEKRKQKIYRKFFEKTEESQEVTSVQRKIPL